MSYILVGDTHIGTKKSSKRYHSIAITMFQEVCDYAKEHDIKYLIQVGDFFDNRKALTHSSIECAITIADMLEQTFDSSYFIVGNHDTSSKDTMFPHSLMIFNEHKKIHVVDKPQLYDNILMLPWMFNIKNDMVDADICIGNFDINGADMNSSGTVSRNHFLNFSDFSKYRLTLSGHYHTPKLYAHNVKYIGSPYQLTFNDINSTRGFWVMDTRDCNVNFIPFHDYPHHLAYNDKSEDIGDIEDNIVRLTFYNDYGIDGNKAIIDRFRELNPYSLRIKYARLDDGMTEETINEDIMVKTKLDILQEFHEKSELSEGVDLALLQKVSESIYKEMKGDE